VELDRQSIEKRDFPIGRRGYDPAAVDSHLRMLAGQVEDLQHAIAGSRGSESLGSAAGTQVQSILEAAETTAAEIERNAAESAQQVRAEAARDAEQTRAEAVARAQAHVEAVSLATATLLQRVESMDEEVGGLVDSLRAGAGRLAADLASVETNMGELYDAASGQAPAPAQAANGSAWAAPAAAPAPPAAPAPAPPAPPRAAAAESRAAPVASSFATTAPRVSSEPRAAVPTAGGGDLDGARLIALNMALNGESRVQTDRYLAENFELADRTKLLDEVYAAIEG
jgi:hypothetical protein